MEADVFSNLNQKSSISECAAANNLNFTFTSSTSHTSGLAHVMIGPQVVSTTDNSSMIYKV